MSTPPRRHWYAAVIGLSTELHVPVCACSVKPTFAVPLTLGFALVGIVPAWTVAPADAIVVVV